MASTILNAAVTLVTSSVALVTCPAGSQVAITDLMVVNGAAAAHTFNLSLYRQATGQVYAIGPANRSLAAGGEPYRYPGKIFLSPGDELRASADQAGALVASAMYAVSLSVTPIWRGLAGRGTYSAAATYAANDIVDDGTTSYISLQDGNKGNTPAAGSSWWMVLARRGLPGADSTVPGPAGPPPTLSKGTATTGAAGSSMDFTLTATGTGSYRLDLTLPRGDPGTGSGDLVGPSASSDGEVMLFSGTTGKLAKRSNTVAGAFGLSLLSAAARADAQATLQLRPGTEVQAYHVNLQALSGLTGAANRIPYFTGAGAMALTPLGNAAGGVPILDTNGYLSAAVQPQITGGDITAPAGSAVHTIAADAVTNTKLANMPAGTIKGNNAGATGDPIDLTGAQANTILPAFTADNGTAAGTKGLVPAPAAGDAAAGKVLGAGGGWVVPSAGGGGGISGARAISAADTIVASDKGKVLNLSGSFILSATAAATLGNGFYCYLRKTDGNGVVVLDPNAAETINGLASINIYQEEFLIWTDGTAWFSQGRRKGWIPIATVALTGQTLSSLSVTAGFLDVEFAEIEMNFDRLVPSASTAFLVQAIKNGGVITGSTYSYDYAATSGTSPTTGSATGDGASAVVTPGTVNPVAGKFVAKDLQAGVGANQRIEQDGWYPGASRRGWFAETTNARLGGLYLYPAAGTISSISYTLKGYRP